MENQLYNLLEQLEELLDRGTKVPLTGRVMLDEDSVLEIIDGIRSGLPGEIREANLILAERDRILENARLESQRIIERAHNEAERLILENEIVQQSKEYSDDLVKQSQEYSDQIVQKAQEYSREVKMGALKYSDDLLNDIESKLEETYKAIKSSREELKSMARWDERVQTKVGNE